MTESHHRPVRPVSGVEDIPLPGMIDCITLQINVTAHRAPGTMKAVGVLRDPNSGFEILRRKVELDSRGTTADLTKSLCSLMHGDLLSLMGWIGTNG